ncbi:MAG: hypothetical protein OM95_12270 [Bdellovibrio sp. ArHS]|uniref:TIGR02147 family protein n=1 Tax=Bdellovibrio sp. ArHS TaxID=1569284 RepID=UPI000582861B|nr:TIGR02147 family protein [Bdellovibrio sp. ArHS]KHD87784.1 MAG: hypothetical protein OM95_12270 [Bdellovibrio sp. ArHS]
MKTLFDFDNYQDFLSFYVSNPEAPRGLRTELAKAMQCQAAYLSQVLNGKAELTEDHAFKLVNHLGFSNIEKEYFTLLVRISRASGHDLQEYLKKQAAALSKVATKVDYKVIAKNLREDEDFTKYYFSSWIPSTVHIATSSPHYQTTAAISQRLGLPEKKVLDCLQLLAEKQLVGRKGPGEWVYQGGNIHLPKSSPLGVNHQIHNRLQAIKSLQTGDDKDLHVSAVFTMDKEGFEALKKLFLDSIEKANKRIAASGTEEIYGMCWDLFEVS